MVWDRKKDGNEYSNQQLNNSTIQQINTSTIQQLNKSTPQLWRSALKRSL